MKNIVIVNYSRRADDKGVERNELVGRRNDDTD